MAIKIEIWCRSAFIDGKRIEAVLARCATRSYHPKKGDYITVWDGWCSEEVRDTHYNVEKDELYVEIGPDTGGEYAAEAAKRG